ncbi:MAG: glycosyltransferase family 2 protein [Planctomycetota bacterium]
MKTQQDNNMRVAGFTIVRNAVRYDYPIVESIRSALPLVDEMVVAVGQCEDGTRELVESIDDDKIRIIDTVWDDKIRTGGTVLAQQTNLAMKHCEGDWLLYLQADEVLHEADYGKIRKSMEKHQVNNSVEGLSFRYHHFICDYSIRDPLPYRRQIRIVKPGIGVRSHGDACGFRIHDRKLRKANTGAWVFHYGYVRPPESLTAKMDYFLSLYDGREVIPGEEQNELLQQYNLSTAEPFHGSHPEIMSERIAAKDWDTPPVPLLSRWRNPRYWKGMVYKNSRTIRRLLGMKAENHSKAA